MVALLVILIAGASAIFLQGTTKIRYGLDLQGGTSVVLQPRIDGTSGTVTAAAIDQAVSIIRQRVNSLGVAESEVLSQGSGINRQIVISVPGESGERVVDLVGQTAELRFRQVLAVGSAVEAPPAPAAAAPSAKDFSSCSHINRCAMQFQTQEPRMPEFSYGWKFSPVFVNSTFKSGRVSMSGIFQGSEPFAM